MNIIKDLGLEYTEGQQKGRRFVLIACPECKIEQKVRADSEIIKQNKCRSCKGLKPITKDKKVNTLEKFIKKATEVHNSKYSYNHSIFTKSSVKTTVTCKFHGNFEITPNNHLRGKGCPKCARNKRGWNRSLYKDVPTSIYYAKVNNKYFKIGISKQGERYRYYRDRKLGNKIEILFETWFFDGSLAYDLEKKMLLLINRYKVKESILVQGGNSELHTINILETLTKKVKELNDYHN